MLRRPPPASKAPRQAQGMRAKKRFLLRLDDSLFAAVEQWAADELRSVNAQIEYVLGEVVRQAGRLQQPPTRTKKEVPKRPTGRVNP